MTSSLPASTYHRLQQLPQIPCVWEGDRRALSPGSHFLDQEDQPSGDCILWVDGSEGLVRSMDVIPETAGLETVVRTLLRAMEVPRPPAAPGRPQKIVVRNREIQFLLRGILQGLDITIDYEPTLPLIDELFRTFESPDLSRPAPLPSAYVQPLQDLGDKLWKLAPWTSLADHEIITLELEIGPLTQTLYACVMGMMGREYGVLFYRSWDSLKQFRDMILTEDNVPDMEQIFLSQDCWFLNYEPEEEEDWRKSRSIPTAIFGSIHPLEGIRPFLDGEECLILYYALEGLRQFVKQKKRSLDKDPIPALESQFTLPPPPSVGQVSPAQLRVLVQPALIKELLEGEEEEDEEDGFVFQENIIPYNSYMSLGCLPWAMITLIRLHPTIERQTLDPEDCSEVGDGMPVLMIQTTRPKAKELVQRLRQECPITGLGFTLGEDPWTETQYDLGVLQTQEDRLFLLGEFLLESPNHRQARKNWDRRCQSTQGRCGLLIAMGVTGQSRGKPQIKHIMGYFETQFLTAQELGVGTLQLIPRLDLEE